MQFKDNWTTEERFYVSDANFLASTVKMQISIPEH